MTSPLIRFALAASLAALLAAPASAQTALRMVSMPPTYATM